MENINEKLVNGFNKTKEGQPFALIIVGENGSGKTAYFRHFFEDNGYRFFELECKKLLPLGQQNAYGLTTEEALNLSLEGYDAVLFDGIDACDEGVRELLLKKVEEVRAQNIFVGATAWPSAHYGREPLAKETLNKYFDEIINL